jgi:hypothetical protein
LPADAQRQRSIAEEENQIDSRFLNPALTDPVGAA